MGKETCVCIESSSYRGRNLGIFKKYLGGVTWIPLPPLWHAISPTQLVFAIELDNQVHHGSFPFIFALFIKPPSVFILTNPYYIHCYSMLYITIGIQDDSLYLDASAENVTMTCLNILDVSPYLKGIKLCDFF